MIYVFVLFLFQAGNEEKKIEVEGSEGTAIDKIDDFGVIRGRLDDIVMAVAKINSTTVDFQKKIMEKISRLEERMDVLEKEVGIKKKKEDDEKKGDE